VLESVYAPLWGGLPVAHYSVSDTGTLAFTRGGQGLRYRSRLVRVDRTGQTRDITSQIGDYAYPRASLDGKRVAVSMQGDDARSIWLVDTARGAATRFTFERGQWTSAWTPSGKLSYQSKDGIKWRPLDNSTAEELLSSDVFWPGSWSPDGRVLAATKPSAETQGDIWLVSADGGELAPLAQSEFNEVGPAFSPDERLIAYVSDESGRNEVYIQPYPGPGEKTLVSTNGGEEPVWSHDGSELFYRNGDQLLSVPMGEDVGAPEILFEKPFHRTRSDVVGAPNYDVTADGKGFIMLAFDDEAAPAQIDVVLNWLEELKRLVPAEK
jgi:Tol biopolymer transport system component